MGVRQFKSLSFAIFCVSFPSGRRNWRSHNADRVARHLSPLTAGTPLPLNNELNLDSASGGDLGAALSLVRGFVARMHVLAGARARTHTSPRRCHSFLPQVVVGEMCRWLAVE